MTHTKGGKLTQILQQRGKLAYFSGCIGASEARHTQVWRRLLVGQLYFYVLLQIHILGERCAAVIFAFLCVTLTSHTQGDSSKQKQLYITSGYRWKRDYRGQI